MSAGTGAVTVGTQLGGAVHQSRALSRTGALERLFSNLFRGLVYAQIWEDPVADLAALDLAPGSDIFCIASGGCNAMSYLMTRPASVTAVDLSPAHVALLKLKAVGARHLDGSDAFYRFFGEAASPLNVDDYDRLLAPALDARTRAYWEGRVLGRRRISMFARGIYRFGLLGRFLSALHAVGRVAGVDFRKILRSRSLAEQEAVFEAEIAPLFETQVVRFLARRRASLFGLGIPPAQYDKLAADGEGDVIPVLRERVRKLVCDFPVAGNYFAWQAFNRGYAPGAGRSVPPYLEPGNFETIRMHAGNIRVENRAMTDLLSEKPARSLDAFVLLDAQDWMTDAQLNALWQEITRTARPGARVIFRTGGAADILPGRVADDLLGRWAYDAAASEAGFRADRSAIYGGFHLYRLSA